MEKIRIVLFAAIAVVAVALLAFLAFVASFVGIVMWQLGIFNMGQATVTSSGFARIKPQLVTISLTADGTFTGIFTNGVGARITIDQKGVVVADASGNQCSTTIVEGASVHVGDNFRINASGCGIRERGDEYTLTFSIPYNVTAANTTMQKNETGTIRGPVE